MERGQEIKKVFIKRNTEINLKHAESDENISLISKEKETSEPSLDNRETSRVGKFLDFIVKFSLFAIFFGLPLFFTGTTFQGIAFEKQMYFYFWTLLALVAWAIRCGYLGEMKIKRTPLDIPIMSFWLFYAIISFFSFDKWHSAFGFFGDPSRGLISITAMVIVYYLLASNFSRKLFGRIMKGFILSGNLVVIWSLIRIMDLKFVPDFLSNLFPVSLVGSIESLMVLAGVLLPLTVSWVLKIQEEDRKKTFHKLASSFLPLVFIVVDFLVLISLYDYVKWIGLLVGIVIFLIFILSKIVKIKESWSFLPIGVFIVVLAFLMIGPVGIAKVQLPLIVDVPYKASLEIAKGSLKDNALIGYGPANYGYAFSKNLPANFDNMDIRFFQGQGIFLESISTIGLIGAALLSILILTFIGVSLYVIAKEKEKNDIYSLGIVSASMMLLVNVLLIKTESFVLLSWVLLSALTIASLFGDRKGGEGGYFNLSLKASPKYALTLAFVYILIFASVAFTFVFLGKIYAADIKMGNATRMEKTSEDGSVTKIIEAININRREGRYYSRLSQEYLALARQELAKEEGERNGEKLQLYFASAVQAGKEAEALMRNDVMAAENLAQVYYEGGMYFSDAPKLAKEKYERALELEPNNPSLHVSIGLAKISMASFEKDQGEKEKLLNQSQGDFERSIELRKNYAPGYFNLALMLESRGEKDKAVENMSTAANLTGDANYVFNLGRLYQSRNQGEDAKMAENLFKKIIKFDPGDISTHFSLGLLYEKTDRKKEAIEEYRKVIELLPENSNKARSQVEKMISNVNSGIANTPESLGLIQKEQEGEPKEETKNEK